MRARWAALVVAVVIAVGGGIGLWASRARATYGQMGSLDAVTKKLSGWGYRPRSAGPAQTRLGGRAVACHTFALDDQDELPIAVYVPAGSSKVIAATAAALYTRRVSAEDYCPANNRECAPLMALRSLAGRTVAYHAGNDAWQRLGTDPLVYGRQLAGFEVQCTIRPSGARGQRQEYVLSGRE